MSYGQTWDDIGATPPARAWQMLRSLRHAPPGWAQKGKRREVFDAALEQAEQLFSAARTVTPAASPLLLFYGLSQAGRAVAAAATGKENANRWNLVGHGITNETSDGLTPATLCDLKMKDQGTGAFTQLADILGAASLSSSVNLGEIWCLLPESARFPLPGMGNKRPIYVNSSPHENTDDSKVIAKVPIPSNLLNRDIVGTITDSTDKWNEVRTAIVSVLNEYPSLAGWRFTTREGQPVGITGYGDTTTIIQIAWDKPSTVQPSEAILRHAAGYRSSHLAFPALGGDPRPPHPYLLWWAVLYALSKLARYEPSLWANSISISSSPAAAAIEHLLRESMSLLPELIHRTIHEAARDR